MNANGMPMGQGLPPGGYQVVPNLVQKFKGNHFDQLVPSDSGINENITVQISNLGSFTNNSERPILLPASQLPAPPTPMKCKDAEFVRELTRDECQEALIQWTGKSCCTGSRQAKLMHVSKADTYNSFIYTLSTFTEKRALVVNSSKVSPGERLDTTANGPIPDPASLPCGPDRMFQNHTKFINLSRTDSLHPCFRCNAFGDLRCSGCNGMCRN